MWLPKPMLWVVKSPTRLQISVPIISEGRERGFPSSRSQLCCRCLACRDCNPAEQRCQLDTQVVDLPATTTTATTIRTVVDADEETLTLTGGLMAPVDPADQADQVDQEDQEDQVDQVAPVDPEDLVAEDQAVQAHWMTGSSSGPRTCRR